MIRNKNCAINNGKIEVPRKYCAAKVILTYFKLIPDSVTAMIQNMKQ
jgi:hypothetical protein